MMPMFKGVLPETRAPLWQVADWLATHIVDDAIGDAMVSSPTHSSGSKGSWEAPLPPAGQIVQGGLPALYRTLGSLSRDFVSVEWHTHLLAASAYIWAMHLHVFDSSANCHSVIANGSYFIARH